MTEAEAGRLATTRELKRELHNHSADPDSAEPESTPFHTSYLKKEEKK